MAEPSQSPEPPELPTYREKRSFYTREEWVAWARENVQDWEQFIADDDAVQAEFDAWRAAGNPGFPPGWISRREYEHQRALRSGL